MTTATEDLNRDRRLRALYELLKLLAKVDLPTTNKPAGRDLAD